MYKNYQLFLIHLIFFFACFCCCQSYKYSKKHNKSSGYTPFDRYNRLFRFFGGFVQVVSFAPRQDPYKNEQHYSYHLLKYKPISKNTTDTIPSFRECREKEEERI